MPLDFPSSPTNGQTFGQYTYDSTKGVWRVAANNATSVISSPTAPSSPVAGNVWFNTNDGSLYVYFNDGDTSQWVELRSEVATSQVGLVPVIPSSIVVGSGTATTSTTGLVTFSGASTLSLNGIFSSAYRHYRMVIYITQTATADLNMRFRTSGTDNSSASYIYSEYYYGSSAGTGNVTSRTQGRFGYLVSGTNSSYVFDIMGPFDSVQTQATGHGMRGDAISLIESTLFSGTTSFDGLTLLAGSGTFTGNVQFYGYK